MRNIDEVIAELDRIIDHAIEKGAPTAIFAYVYKRTTEQIKDGLVNKRFQDSGRMEHFDIVFAKRFIDAYWQYEECRTCPESWLVSFEVDKRRMSHMQHVMLGMNAHINLDLGIAAAEIAPGRQIHSLKSDFMLVNQMLEELIDEIQVKLGKISWSMRAIDWLGGRMDESLVDFFIRRARGFAWLTALNMARLDEYEKQEYIAEMDAEIAELARHVSRPPSRAVRQLIRLVRLFEHKDVRVVLKRLEE